MAKVNLGILDGFNGKVGTVVGYSRYGKDWMRAYTDEVSDRRSGEQLLVRARFRLLSLVGSGMLTALQVGLAEAPRRHGNTPSNTFMHLNWVNATGATPAAVEVDYASLQLSEGHLPQPSFSQASFAQSQSVSVEFPTHSDLPKTSDDDLVYLFVYQPESNMGLLSPAVSRSTGSISLLVPSEWVGLDVHVYGFAIGDGEENAGMRSSTAYLGSGTIG
ncbi:MAG: hypothetical protein IJU19_01365 [Bacteroidales bacterium]|nr:hypothetical protein [Bacteroidales bacterium]